MPANFIAAFGRNSVRACSNRREERDKKEGDPRSTAESKIGRTYGHHHISINEFSGYRVYFRSVPATQSYSQLESAARRCTAPVLDRGIDPGPVIPEQNHERNN